MTHRLLPALLVAVLLIFLQLRSGADTSYVVVVVTMAMFAYVVIAGGRLLLDVAGVRSSDPNSAYALGVLATSLGVYGLTVLFPLVAGAAFGIVAAVVIGLEIALARKFRAPPQDWRALAGFALCVAFTAAWCTGPANAYEVVRTQGVLPVWSDYFVHGSIISQFGDVRAVGHQSILLADFPPSFYHFGSYTAAAALAGVLDQPGLPIATSVWMPLGFLAMTAGAYALGERLAGAAGGLGALGAIAILPDASNYGLRNGFLSFHWSMMAHPGAMYALGAAFVSMALLDRWIREQSTKALLASVALAASIFSFRVHVFLLYLPAWIATAVYCRAQDPVRKRLVALMLLAALGASGAAASVMLTRFALLDPSAQWWFGGPALGKFLTEIHGWHEPTAYTGLYSEVVSGEPSWYSLGIGILLAIVAALGVFTVLLPGAAAHAHHRGEFKAIDVFPAYLAYCWMLLMLFAPVTWHQEGTHLIHEPLVLLYASAAIWTVCLLLRSLESRGGRLANRLWQAMFLGSAVALPLTLIGADGMARPKFAWGAPYIANRVAPGLVEVAAFLRKQSPVGAVFAAGGLSNAYVFFDLPMQISSLSGMASYLSRPYLEMIKDAPRKRVVEVRLAALAEIEKQDDYGVAMELLNRLGVQWYVVAGEAGPRWDLRRERAAFSAGTVAVYAARKQVSSGAFHDEMGIRNADQAVAHDAKHLLELGSGKRLVGLQLAHVAATID